jgi:thioesterase domain-containing protein
MTNALQSEIRKIEKITVGPWTGDVLVFPTTLAQRRFWSFDRENPGDPAYNIAVRMRLAGALDLPSLHAAADEILRRHEMLRTVFSEEDGEPVQLVAPSLTIPIPVIDLREVPEDQRAARAEQLSVEEARTKFSLDVGPLLRMTLLRLKDDEHIMLVTVHQTVSDCWSIGMISFELGTLYGAFSEGRESPLPELPIQYGDYAVWQKQWLDNLGLNQQLAYWTKQLAGLPPLEVPTDLPRPPKKTSNGEILSAVLPLELTESLKNLSHREGCTFFMLSLAAFQVLLHRLTRQDDLYVGTITAGRSRVEMEQLIGRFINPLIIRNDLSGNPTFLTLLANVRERVLDALDNRDVPYERVVEALGFKKDPSRHPVFQVNFVHQRAFIRPLQLSSVTLTGIPSKSAGAIYDLYFFMVERAEGWRLSCEYNTDLYTAESVEEMLAHFRNILQGIAREPDRRLSELPSPKFADPAPVAGSSPNGQTARQESDPVAARPFVAPRDETEARLAALWCQVIGVKQVSVTSDFFDEGGHSVLAARILYHVEKVFGKELSLGAFLRAPTIEQFAVRLRDAEVDIPLEQICVIQPGESVQPLFLVDAGYTFLPLAEHLGSQQPVYGLLLPQLTKLPQRFTVEDIADNLMDALLEAQPHGPYYLAGWCSAGIVAYELARRLRARGEEVALVALFDAWSPLYAKYLKSVRGLPSNLAMRFHRLRYHVRTAAKLSFLGFCAYGLERVASFRDQLRLKLWRLWYRRLNRPAGPAVRHSGQFKNLAASEYNPKPLDAPVVLFRAEMFQGCPIVDPQWGWGELARGGLQVHDLVGDHGAMLFQEPHLARLADILAKYLNVPANPPSTDQRVSDSIGEIA